MEFTALTIRASALQQAVFAGVSAAPRTIIAGRTGRKPVPTIPAQTLVGLTNAFAAVDADRRPKKLVQALQNKNAGLS